MDLETKSTEEILDVCEHVGCHKAENPLKTTLIMGFFAGMYIAFGALGSLMASASFREINPSLTRLISGAVFPVGLMLVLLAGAELFTGNCLLAVGLMRKKISLYRFTRNLCIVWVMNLVGSLFVGILAVVTHTMTPDVIAHLQATAMHKAHPAFWQILLKGIGCNVLVAGAVWLSYATKDFAGKVLGIWFPIMVFIVLGFDHVVANMFYLPTAMMTGAEISFAALVKNLLAATIGNMIGGCLVLAGLYELALSKKKA